VLYGTADTLFEKWRLYMRYVGEAVPRALSLPDDVATQFRQFVDGMFPLLDKAEKQAREKLAGICKAVEEGRVKIKSGKAVSHICADDACIKIHANEHSSLVALLTLHGISTETYFPDMLRVPREELEAFQIGWRASDETAEDRRPMMVTTQPWQLFAWSATRPGWMRVHVINVGINASGLSLQVYAVARGWEQRWTKKEAQRLALEVIQRGDYRLLLTWWLGDGVVNRRNLDLFLSIGVNDDKNAEILGRYNAAKMTREIIGRKAVDLANMLLSSASRYGAILDVLYSHKWMYLKKLASIRQFSNPFYISIKGIKLRLHLSAKTLHTVRYFTKREEAEKALNALKPHAKMYKDRQWYVVYIPWVKLRELI
jgi:hypothetical protein